MTCPITVLPFKGLNKFADKDFGDPVVIKGYFAGAQVVVNDTTNTQVISGTQVYFDPTIYTVNIEDRILVDGQEKDIVSLSNYMDGNFGTSSIKVAYL